MFLRNFIDQVGDLVLIGLYLFFIIIIIIYFLLTKNAVMQNLKIIFCLKVNFKHATCACDSNNTQKACVGLLSANTDDSSINLMYSLELFFIYVSSLLTLVRKAT